MTLGSEKKRARARTWASLLVPGLGATLLLCAVGWVFFAMSMSSDSSYEDANTEFVPEPVHTDREQLQPHHDVAEAAAQAVPARRHPMRSIAPAVKAAKRPPYRVYLENYNLRQCECRKDWQEMPADAPNKCLCSGPCPAFVDPPFLTAAAGQGVCALTHETGFNCQAACGGETSTVVKWNGQSCGSAAGSIPCDPRILSIPPAAAPAEPSPQPSPAPVEAPPPSPSAAAAAAPRGPSSIDWDPEQVLDLRGLQCELLDGHERCFYEDAQGRELCPPHVTSEWLANPQDQHMCTNAMADKYYCTAGCQEGNDEVRWGANEVAWCDAPANRGSCSPRKRPIPKSEFKLKEWSAPKEVEKPCQAAARRGEKPSGVIAGVTFGMLTHEPRSMKDSLASYEANGMFAVVDEFLVYVNKRRPEVDAVLEPYVLKYPGKVRVMGDENNYGILRGMNFLTGNASNPYILFLERDFQLVEPATCVVEQVNAGLRLLKADVAQVVRYRHRKRAGRPNWAERMFRGHEDDVFKGSQPNLFCNHFYWYDKPEKRWPDKIWVCNKDEGPEMHCSDSFYCNWTNNPQMWSIAWWNKEYVDGSFKQKGGSDPFHDLESWMNWAPHSWNDRKFTVAQGDGLFKHVDRGNFGIS